MKKSRLFIHFLISTSLTLGLTACNQKLETAQNPESPKMTKEAPLTVKPTVESTVTPTIQSTTLNPTEPQLEEPPVIVTPSSAPVPAPKITPAVNKKTDPIPGKKVEAPKKASPPPTQPPTVKKEEPKKEESVTASNFIIATYNTMVKEGKKIGAACNFYIERVLEVLGFKTVDFLANDFDVAAKKIFKNYKVAVFTNATELKRHLWSYRERTGFICQWERIGAPGHIAIVERVGETLWIYQASLNKYTARVEKTTLEHLLQVNNNKGVRVYSDFVK
jgi:hypothetical protein